MLGWLHSLRYSLISCWRLLPVVWRFRTWDYRYNLDLFRESLEMTAAAIERNGNHVGYEETVAQIRETVLLLESFDEGIKAAEAELGEIDMEPFYAWLKEEGELLPSGAYRMPPLPESDHDSAVFKRSKEIEEQRWNDLWDNIKANMRAWWD